LFIKLNERQENQDIIKPITLKRKAGQGECEEKKMGLCGVHGEEEVGALV